jgi:hypothetical protein
VYLQGEKHESVFPNIEVQIWRQVEHLPNEEAQTFNVAVQGKAGVRVDLCPNVDHPFFFIQSVRVEKGTENIDTATVSSFSIADPEAGIAERYKHCSFKGTGTYSALGEGLLSSAGSVAGTLTCDGLSVVCSRPDQYNLGATTCGGEDVSKCGKLGKDCDTYHQLLALCRIQSGTVLGKEGSGWVDESPVVELYLQASWGGMVYVQ